MNSIGKNNFEFTGIQAGTKVLVTREGSEWEERIFLTSIQGAWYPYICVAVDYEDDYKNGKPFEVMTWFDLKEIKGAKTIVLPQLHFSGYSNEV